MSYLIKDGLSPSCARCASAVLKHSTAQRTVISTVICTHHTVLSIQHAALRTSVKHIYDTNLNTLLFAILLRLSLATLKLYSSKTPSNRFFTRFCWCVGSCGRDKTSKSREILDRVQGPCAQTIVVFCYNFFAQILLWCCYNFCKLWCCYKFCGVVTNFAVELS